MPKNLWWLIFMGHMRIGEKVFPITLGLSALFVASVAAFFSVMGIGMLFSGAVVSAMVMATALEVGKLTATTYLYRYWNKTTSFLKTYLVLAVFVLMVITSLGVFGWLSAAYQASAMRYEITQQQITLLTEQKTRTFEEAEVVKKRISDLSTMRTDQEKRFNDVINNPILARNPTQLRQVQEQNLQLIKDTDTSIGEVQRKYSQLVSSTSDIDTQINGIKMETIKTKDVITFKFVADALGVDMTTTVKWFIALIISVFDPLAICLILAYNVTIFIPKRDDVVIVEPTPTPSPTPTIVEEVKKN